MHSPPLCSRKELADGTYTLNDLADFHEVLDEEAEYRARFEELKKQDG
jgi:hypothetical protein